MLAPALFLLRNGYRLKTHSTPGISLDGLLGPITEDFIVRDRPAALLADLLADFVEEI